MVLAAVTIIALPIIGARSRTFPTIGAQLNAVTANLQLGMGGAFAMAMAIILYGLAMDGVTGLTGSGGSRTAAAAASYSVQSFWLRRTTRRGLFRTGCLGKRRLHQALARAGSIEAPSRSFTSAMTRPMSFIEDAPVFGDDRADLRFGFGVAELLRGGSAR